MRPLERLFRKTPKPELPPSTPQKSTPAKAEGMNRREFLSTLGKATAGIVITGAASEPWIRSALDSDSMESEKQPEDAIEHSDTVIEIDHEVNFDALNRDTAIPVAAGFVAFVGNAAAGGSLGPASIVGMSALEANRLSHLYRGGGEHGRHVADEELHENLVAGALAMGLAGISDLTTSAVKFEAQKLLETAHKLEESDAGHVMERPSENAALEQWEAYCEQIEQELADQATRLIAVTGVIAPFSTTYTSSVVANQMKGGTARLVFEQSMAKSMVDQKRTQHTVAIEVMEAEAQQRTNELMKQFTDLMTALSANIQGGVLAGDPPQFFGLADQWGNWSRLLKAEAFGLANDVVMTSALTSMWFKQANIAEPKVLSRLAEHTAELARQAGGLSPAELPKEDIVVNGESIEAALDGVNLSTNTTATQAAKNSLKNMVSYRATFSLQGYAQKKANWMKRLPGVDHVVRVMELSSTASKEGSPLQQLQAFLLEGRTVQSSAGTIDFEMNALLAQLGDQIEEYAAADREVDRTMLPASIHEVDPLTVDELRDGLQTVTNTETNRLQTIEDILLELGLEPEAIAVMDEDSMHREIVKILRRESTNNPGKVAELAAQFAQLDKAGSPPVVAETKGHDDAHFFNHTGIEVRDALLTQLPAVGACAVLAEQSLTKAFSLQGGTERSSVTKVTAAIGAALTSEAIISSLADNVAAYKYGYKVLRAMIEKVYGEASQAKFGKSVLEAFPFLHDVIFAIALKLAEQAGALTKLGNGPNFSQEEIVIMSQSQIDTYMGSLTLEQRTKVVVEKQGVGSGWLVRRPLPFKLYDNRFANAANAGMLTLSVGMLGAELIKLEASLAQAS